MTIQISSIYSFWSIRRQILLPSSIHTRSKLAIVVSVDPTLFCDTFLMGSAAAALKIICALNLCCSPLSPCFVFSSCSLHIQPQSLRRNIRCKLKSKFIWDVRYFIYTPIKVKEILRWLIIVTLASSTSCVSREVTIHIKWMHLSKNYKLYHISESRTTVFLS